MIKLKKGDIAKDYNGDRWRIEIESSDHKKVLKWDESGALESWSEESLYNERKGYRFVGSIGVDEDNFGERVAWVYSPYGKIILGE